MAKKTISRDIPLAELTLRRYEKPTNLQGRDLVRKLCLSIGLLQPGDSRDVVVDVLSVMLKTKKELTSQDVEKMVVEARKKHKLPMNGIASSNIRRQLKRLKDIFIIESIANKYRVNENATLSEIFEERIEKFYLKNITDRVRDYFNAIER
jgi:hypothetical protein|tara:strand:- start:24 stop:476 length:453 start_codon:yes stop_codon:yes gene_type:complete